MTHAVGRRSGSCAPSLIDIASCAAVIRAAPHHSLQSDLFRRKTQQWAAQRELRQLHIMSAAEAPSSSSSSSAATEQQATAQDGEIDPWYLEQVARMEAEGVRCAGHVAGWLHLQASAPCATQRSTALHIADAPAPACNAPACSEEASDYVAHLQQTLTVPGVIEFSANEAGLPRVTLRHPNGSSAELYLHGAAVTSWVDQAGRELLHLRPGNSMDGRKPIRWGAAVGSWPPSCCCCCQSLVRQA